MQETTLAILAGGAGSRMGAPKARLQLHGRPILEYLLQRFDWKGPTMLVTAPGFERPPGFERFGREVFDPIAGIGPLRGVLTAIEQSETEIVVVATVDMPMITGEQLSWIVNQLVDRPELLGAMSSRIASSVEHIEPFPSAFRKSARTTIELQISQQRRSVRGLLNGEGFATLPIPRSWPEDLWLNLNTPADLVTFVARVSNPCLPQPKDGTG